MAVYYFRNTGSTDWGLASNWSLTDGGGATGAVPTLSDDAYFTANSGSATITTTNKVCRNLITTGFSGSINCTLVLTTYGDVTLSSTTSINGTGSLGFAGTNQTLTRNGASISAIFRVVSIGTLTLADDWNVVNILLAGSNVVLNGSNLNFTGNITVNAGTGTGTTQLNYTGTSKIWSGTGAIRNPFTVKTGSSLSLSGTVAFNGALLKVESGATFTTTSSTLSITTSSTSLDLGTAELNNLTVTGTINVTNVSITVVNGTLTIGNNSFLTNPVHVKGNFSASTNTGTTGTLIVNGTGNQTWSSASGIRMNLQINKPSGTLFISGNVGFNTATLTYITGNVDPTGSTLIIAASATLNTSGIVWNNIVFQGAVTLTLSSLLTANLINLSGTGNSAFAGTFGFTCNTLTHQSLTGSRTVTFGALNDYVVNTSLTFNSSFAINLTSSHASIRANLRLTYGGTQNVRNTNATRIDSSGGETIYTSVGNGLTSTINWGKSEGNMLLVL